MMCMLLVTVPSRCASARHRCGVPRLTCLPHAAVRGPHGGRSASVLRLCVCIALRLLKYSIQWGYTRPPKSPLHENQRQGEEGGTRVRMYGGGGLQYTREKGSGERGERFAVNSLEPCFVCIHRLLCLGGCHP